MMNMESLYMCNVCSALPCILPNDFCEVCMTHCEVTCHLRDLQRMAPRHQPVSIIVHVAHADVFYLCILYMMYIMFACCPLKNFLHGLETAGGGADSQVAQKDDGRCWWKQRVPT